MFEYLSTENTSKSAFREEKGLSKLFDRQKMHKKLATDVIALPVDGGNVDFSDMGMEAPWGPDFRVHFSCYRVSIFRTNAYSCTVDSHGAISAVCMRAIKHGHETFGVSHN